AVPSLRLEQGPDLLVVHGPHRLRVDLAPFVGCLDDARRQATDAPRAAGALRGGGAARAGNVAGATSAANRRLRRVARVERSPLPGLLGEMRACRYRDGTRFAAARVDLRRARSGGVSRSRLEPGLPDSDPDPDDRRRPVRLDSAQASPQAFRRA